MDCPQLPKRMATAFYQLSDEEAKCSEGEKSKVTIWKIQPTTLCRNAPQWQGCLCSLQRQASLGFSAVLQACGCLALLFAETLFPFS